MMHAVGVLTLPQATRRWCLPFAELKTGGADDIVVFVGG